MTQQGKIHIPADRLEVWQKSTQVARKERVRVWQLKRPDKHGNTLYRARARLSPSIYTLFTSTLETHKPLIVCSCPGYEFRRYCKHAVRLAIYLANQGKDVALP